MQEYKIGLDIGSTTAKIIVTDKNNTILFSKYVRHNANVPEVVISLFYEVKEKLGEISFFLAVTGSVGMGICEKLNLNFVQELVAATKLINKVCPDISTIIDIGGEDAKIVYLNKDGSTDLRMNGNCAGGTGAFIDQMAILLGISIAEMDSLAQNAKHIYPIASRCGVFSKTDIQNLISKNVSKEDISASIFHAIAVQTVVTLSHGCEIIPKVFLCGGPLTFIPSLRKAFVNYLKLSEQDFITTQNANIITAWGTALCAGKDQSLKITEFIGSLKANATNAKATVSGLGSIFKDKKEYTDWRTEKENNKIQNVDLKTHTDFSYLGVDSGSTTTKIVLTDGNDKILFSHYASNEGNPIAAVKKGLQKLQQQCQAAGVNLSIKNACSTGYGEDLVKAAFNFNGSIVETIAHYLAAKKTNPDVSFILDIGGQDMKAMFVENGVLNRMEINEACSSGCGSFIETFAKSLNSSIADFAKEACFAQNPSDLGTRCTVFMNSKVKQVLRDGATAGDIAAGLSYSVVKNCLYKVLKIRKESELGKNIVVQGGTMRNDSVVKAFENLIGCKVYRSNIPELMGALGCALYAKQSSAAAIPVALEDILNTSAYSAQQIKCRGCENRCLINKYLFITDNVYFSGNKCEKIFSNNGSQTTSGINVYTQKYNLLFNRKNIPAKNRPAVGIPRALNMYEEYPFWHTLFNECGIDVVLSDPSTFKNYEDGVHSVMSDNICFPAKLMHSHIYNLIDKKVDRIFIPYVIFEKPENKNSVNTYNCPIVSGYSDVIKSVINNDIPINSPAISFKDKKLLEKSCKDYLKTWGISSPVIKKAVKKALAVLNEYERELRDINKQIYIDSRASKKLTILLAGRPYHADPLIQHKISDMISAMGANVINEDIVRKDEDIDTSSDTYLLTQWAYVNRILKAAKWAARQGKDVHFVQMTSFGCGPDAFLLDEVKALLQRHAKTLTLLKIDDVNNIGSFKLRVRSVIESLKFNAESSFALQSFVQTKQFKKEDRNRKILIPFFNDYISPLIGSLGKLAGYDIESLPESDLESAELGLKYANNEVCYPATLVVGDIMKALKSGKYNTRQLAVCITQTGGQCRASNYISLIKRAIVEAGFENVPVISLGFVGDANNEQAALKINWLKIANITFITILFSDCISKFYHAAVVREKQTGTAKYLKDKYLTLAQPYLIKNNPDGLMDLLSDAAEEFDSILSERETIPKVGLVGEIYLKFNSFANKRLAHWLIDNKIEVAPPTLLNFFLQFFVNNSYNNAVHLQKKTIPDFVMKNIYSILRRQIERVNKTAAKFRRYVPFSDIFEEAKHGQQVISLCAQFGEGWLLPAEVISFAKNNVNNVISLQPFGCIANHIVSKGVEKKIKTLYPQINLLSLDFDSGVSEVNITNRLLLFANNLK